MIAWRMVVANLLHAGQLHNRLKPTATMPSSDSRNGASRWATSTTTGSQKRSITKIPDLFQTRGTFPCKPLHTGSAIRNTTYPFRLIPLYVYYIYSPQVYNIVTRSRETKRDGSAGMNLAGFLLTRSRRTNENQFKNRQEFPERSKPVYTLSLVPRDDGTSLLHNALLLSRVVGIQ